MTLHPITVDEELIEEYRGSLSTELRAARAEIRVGAEA